MHIFEMLFHVFFPMRLIETIVAAESRWIQTFVVLMSEHVASLFVQFATKSTGVILAVSSDLQRISGNKL